MQSDSDSVLLFYFTTPNSKFQISIFFKTHLVFSINIKSSCIPLPISSTSVKSIALFDVDDIDIIVLLSSSLDSVYDEPGSKLNEIIPKLLVMVQIMRTFG